MHRLALVRERLEVDAVRLLPYVAEAVREWQKEADISDLKIWGYRNVWYRFNPADADIIIPVSLNTLAVFQSMFLESYLSQKEASFPSHEYDGPFSGLAHFTGKEGWKGACGTISGGTTAIGIIMGGQEKTEDLDVVNVYGKAIRFATKF